MTQATVTTKTLKTTREEEDLSYHPNTTQVSRPHRKLEKPQPARQIQSSMLQQQVKKGIYQSVTTVTYEKSVDSRVVHGVDFMLPLFEVREKGLCCLVLDVYH